MNREQRRKAGIKDTEPVVNVKVSEIEALRNQVANIEVLRNKERTKAVNDAYVLMLAIPIMLIHDHYADYMKRVVNGKSREQRFAEACVDLFDTFSIDDGLQINDFVKFIKEEVGIDLTGFMKK